MPIPPAFLEPLFQALTLDLLIPATSAFPQAPKKTDHHALQTWFDDLCVLETRDTAFLDEKLSFAVAVTIPPDEADAAASSSSSSGSGVPAEVAALAAQLQLTATATFLPPLNAGQQPVDKRVSVVSPPGTFAAAQATPTTAGPAGTPRGTTRFEDAPPITPVPVPASTPTAAAQQYASMEGVVVWEGLVETPDAARPVILKTDKGWVAVWRGEMPVIYVRTAINNPVLALTASATLRDSGKAQRRTTLTLNDAASIHIALPPETEEEHDDNVVDIAELEEIDLLGGLAHEPMPASRLGPSLRDDLSVRGPPSLATFSPSPSGTPYSATARTPRTPLATQTTLRKSFRRVLNLSPGLRVRMRTLFLQQLLPPTDRAVAVADSDDAAGERRIVLSIEIENGAEAGQHTFEVENVTVDVGGKGTKVGTSLMCQPGQGADPPASVFPLTLQHLEQYNLLYSVDVGTAPGTRGDDHRPVSIVLVGRPVNSAAQGGFVTPAFQSRWNCALDLAPFYASLPPAPPAPQAHAPQSRQMAHRLSKPTPPTPNAIAGDKRYSLAALMADKPAAGAGGPGTGPDRRLVSNPPRPLLPSTANRVVSTRGGPPPSAVGDGHGLLVSVKVLPSDGDGISALDTFSIEVFAHNRTDTFKRFRLSIPPRDASEGRVRDAWNRRRRRTPDEPAYGADDNVLLALLAQHEAAAPGLVPLETDVRCGPLLPGASLAARIRFLALRNGVHHIERMRITGIGEDYDFVVSPVLEVVVGVPS